jgi:hypothetical protein
MAGNASLNAAGRAKRDEFYTQLTDIEKELRHYREHFAGKTVLCNCDDPFESDFFKYFVLNFNRLGLKKLMATCYTGSPIAFSIFDILDESPEDNTTLRTPYKAIVTSVRDATGDGSVTMNDVAELFRSHENELTELKGDGDFRSQECLDLMDEADIVVTNPPFSLFREYVATLMRHNKKFIIIGNQNAITYKEIFPLLKHNEIWLGFEQPKHMYVPDTWEHENVSIDEKGRRIASFGNICWFTNLDIKKRHEEMILVQRYDPERYPHYDNYDAIEVSKTADIPCDYAGNMGVPITFLDKYDPEQFEILMLANGNARTNTNPEMLNRISYQQNSFDKGGLGVIQRKRVYARILIRNLHPEKPRNA